MHCRVRFLLNFDIKIHSGQVWYTEKATKIWQNLQLLSEITLHHHFFSHICVAFSEYMNFKVWVFWEGHKIWKNSSSYFWQECRVLCAQQRNYQKADKDFLNQIWTSCNIQTLIVYWPQFSKPFMVKP